MQSLQNNNNHLSRKRLTSASTCLFSTLILAGCATTPRHYVNPLTLPSVNSWALSGKIAVQYPSENCHKQDCPPRSDQGSIRWTQTQTHYHIVISDPFGKVVSTIKGNERIATIRDSKGTHEVNPSQMLAQVLHLPVRLPTVTQWVTGRHDTTLPAAIQTREGFVQTGVTVEPSLWRIVEPLGKMPSKVVMRTGENEVRLVIKQWRLP